MFLYTQSYLPFPQLNYQVFIVGTSHDSNITLLSYPERMNLNITSQNASENVDQLINCILLHDSPLCIQNFLGCKPQITSAVFPYGYIMLTIAIFKILSLPKQSDQLSFLYLETLHSSPRYQKHNQHSKEELLRYFYKKLQQNYGKRSLLVWKWKLKKKKKNLLT